MNIITNPEKTNWSEILKRPTQSYAKIEETVKSIFDEVTSKGDFAISKYTSFFDGVTLDSFEVSADEIIEAKKLISNELKEAIHLAKSNIERFH